MPGLLHRLLIPICFFYCFPKYIFHCGHLKYLVELDHELHQVEVLFLLSNIALEDGRLA
jgi:hypothetical protein